MKANWYFQYRKADIVPAWQMGKDDKKTMPL